MLCTHTIEIITIANKGTGIVSRKYFKAGETVFSFQGALVLQPKVYVKALQLDESLFLESDGSFDENLNHSCDPNCYVSFGRYPEDINLNALRDIEYNEELTFNYNTTEWDLIEQQCTFACRCDADCCIGEIKGFKYLTVEQKLSISTLLSPFLKRKLAAECHFSEMTMLREEGVTCF